MAQLQVGQGAVMDSNDLESQDVEHKYYKILEPINGWPKLDDIPAHMKPILRPIAETLAMLDGNAFFCIAGTNGSEWYEQYLPEAWTLFEDNGGMQGWSGQAHFVRELHHENAEVAQAYENWQMLKSMYHE